MSSDEDPTQTVDRRRDFRALRKMRAHSQATTRRGREVPAPARVSKLTYAPLAKAIAGELLIGNRRLLCELGPNQHLRIRTHFSNLERDARLADLRQQRE